MGSGKDFLRVEWKRKTLSNTSNLRLLRQPPAPFRPPPAARLQPPASSLQPPASSRQPFLYLARERDRGTGEVGPTGAPSSTVEVASTRTGSESPQTRRK